MKVKNLPVAVIVALVISAFFLQAADEPPAPAIQPASPPQEFWDNWRNLTPDQREAKMKELKEKYPDAAAEMEKRREEMKKRAEEFKKMTPEEREAKRKEWRDRMETIVNELRKKKEEGTISEDEAKRLARMEEWLKKVDASQKAKEEKESTPKESPPAEEKKN